MILFLTCLLLPVPAGAQEVPAVSGKEEKLSFGFRQDFNNYLWRAKLSYSFPVRSRQRLIVSDLFTSNLLKTEARANKWKDDHRLLLQYEFSLRPGMVPLIRLQSTGLTDKQSGFQNSFRTNFAGVGLRWTPRAFLQVQANTGWKSDERFSRTNRGWHADVQMAAVPFKLADYTSSFSLEWRHDQFRHHHDRDFALQYRVSRQFYANTSDSLLLRFGRHRRMYYISPAGDFESREEQENLISNRMQYGLGRKVVLRMLATLFSRRSAVNQTIADEPTGRRERRDAGADLQGSLLVRFSRLRGSLEWLFSSLDQTFLASAGLRPTPFMGSIGVPDNSSKTNALRGSLSWQPSPQDSLALGFLISRLQYDTPDSNNFDDRDELRIVSGLSYQRKLSPVLIIGFGLRASLHHLVYLFAQRSANNNWNRILHLTSLLEWRPSRRSVLKQRAEVMANYTSYDFEAVQYQIRSFVYRKFTLTDSLRLGETLAPWQFVLFHRLELEENGRLNWEGFSEQPLLDRRNHYLALGAQKRFWNRFFVYLGISAYLRREWRYRQSALAQTRQHYGDFLSWGPQVRIFLFKNGRRTGLISLSNFKVTPPKSSPYRVLQVNLNAHWYF